MKFKSEIPSASQSAFKFYSRREGKSGISVSEINFVLVGKFIKEMLLRVSGSIVKDKKLSERVSNVKAAMNEFAECLSMTGRKTRAL